MADTFRVNVVLADRSWVLEQVSRELERRLPSVGLSMEPDRSADINYYVTYSAYRPGIGGRQAGFFTHIEERSPDAVRRFFEVARSVDAAVAMAERYAQPLRDAGVEDVRLICPGIDLDRFRPVVRIGVVGRTYHTGRKGEDLIRAVMDEPHVEWHFTGAGWPGPARMLADDEVPAFYRTIDYLLVPSYYEGGPMPVLEALASGVEVIAPDVGFAGDYPHIPFALGDAADLRRVLRELVEIRLARRRSVADRTWDAWAEGHDRLFHDLMRRPPRAAMAPTDRSRQHAGASGRRRARVLVTTPGRTAGQPRSFDDRWPVDLASQLAAHGVDVALAATDRPDPRGFDLVHVVGGAVGAMREHLRHLRRYDVPVVLSPGAIADASAHWAERALAPICHAGATDASIDATIAQARSTLPDLRAAVGQLLSDEGLLAGSAVREAIALSNHLVLSSEEETVGLNRIGALLRPFSLVHEGVDTTSIAGGSGSAVRAHLDGRDYVLAAGAIVPANNHLLLARALRDTPIDLVLAGEVPDPACARAIARQGGRVHVLPELARTPEDLAAAIAGARVVALPVWGRPCRQVSLAAAAAGLPLVLSDRLGEREYFGPLARYVDPFDPAAIRAAVLAAWDEGAGAIARAWIDSALTLDHEARQLADAYARALESSDRERPLADAIRPEPRRLDIDPGQPLPVPAATFDALVVREGLERMRLDDARGCLAECARVLRPGGRIEIRAEDVEYTCRRHADWMPDEEQLVWLLHGAGFTHVERHEPFDRLQFRARRAAMLPAAVPAAGPAPAAPEPVTPHTARPERPAQAPGPPILWDGPIVAAGADADPRHALLRGLLRAGVLVRLLPREESKVVERALDADPDAWLWRRALRRRFPGGVCLHVYGPADAMAGPSIAARSARDVFDAHVALVSVPAGSRPAGWRHLLDDADEVWVSSARERRTLVDLGVEDDKVRVIPRSPKPADSAGAPGSTEVQWIVQRVAVLAPVAETSTLDDYEQGVRLWRRRQRRRSLPHFQRAAATNGNALVRADAWFHLGQHAIDEGRTDEAIAAFSRCLAEQPDHAGARARRSLLRGRTLEAAGDLTGAVEAYRDAHGAEPQWLQGAYALASVLERRHAYDEAARLFDQVARTGRRAALRGGAHFHLATIHDAAGAPDVARRHLESCLIEIPQHAAAAKLLADISAREAEPIAAAGRPRR